MARYIIIGAGAVGASLAAQFQRHGIDYVLVGRGEQIAHIREHGLRYRTFDFEKTLALQTASSPDQVELHTDDRLVLTVKTQDVENTLNEWVWRSVVDAPAGFSTADLPLVTVQNGLHTESAALRWFRQVHAGTLLIPARFTETGSVTVGAGPKVAIFAIGRYPEGSDAVTAAIAEDFRTAEYIVEETSTITEWKAAKLLHSVKNGLEVLSGDKEQRKIVGDRLVEETRAVLQTAGYTIGDLKALKQDTSGFALSEEAGFKPGQQSTWQSFTRGKTHTEVDYLNGEIVHLGRLHNTPTPFNEAVQQVLGQSARNQEIPGTRSVSEVLAIVQA